MLDRKCHRVYLFPPGTSSGETGETDSTLITELLSIQLDMKTYRQDKKQLQWENDRVLICVELLKPLCPSQSVLTKWHVCAPRAWQKLRVVLKGWLQTSGKDDQMETKAVCEELEEVGARLFSLVRSVWKSITVCTHLQICRRFSFGADNWSFACFPIHIVFSILTSNILFLMSYTFCTRTSLEYPLLSNIKQVIFYLFIYFLLGNTSKFCCWITLWVRSSF